MPTSEQIDRFHRFALTTVEIDEYEERTGYMIDACYPLGGCDQSGGCCSDTPPEGLKELLDAISFAFTVEASYDGVDPLQLLIDSGKAVRTTIEGTGK